MAKLRKKWNLGKKLEDFNREEQEVRDESSYKGLDFTDNTTGPVLEDEYFGGFRPTEKDFSKKKRKDGRYCSDGEFSRSGRGPKGWAGEPPDQMPPFARQLVRQAEQVLPQVTPDSRSGRMADRRDPDDRPLTPHGILHAERRWFYAQHTERRVQALYLRRYKPSKKLELKRMPTLTRLPSSPLLTRNYLARGLRQIGDDRRVEYELLLARFLAEGGVVRVCPAEKTAAQLQKRKIGRPSIDGRAMTDAERKQRSRANQQPKRSPPQERPQPGAAEPTPHRPAVPGTLSELEYAMTKSFLENLHERLGEVLARLKDAPPDYIVCGGDLQILAMAAVMYRGKQLHH